MKKSTFFFLILLPGGLVLALVLWLIFRKPAATDTQTAGQAGAGGGASVSSGGLGSVLSQIFGGGGGGGGSGVSLSAKIPLDDIFNGLKNLFSSSANPLFDPASTAAFEKDFGGTIPDWSDGLTTMENDPIAFPVNSDTGAFSLPNLSAFDSEMAGFSDANLVPVDGSDFSPVGETTDFSQVNYGGEFAQQPDGYTLQDMTEGLDSNLGLTNPDPGEFGLTQDTAGPSAPTVTDTTQFSVGDFSGGDDLSGIDDLA